MRASLFRGVTVLGVLAIGASTPAAGQWAVGIEIGADRFWGGSEEVTGDGTSFLPYRPTVLGLGLEHRSSSLGVGLRFHYTDAGLALEGPEVTAVASGAFDVYGISPELGYRLATLGGDNQLILRGGPLVELWHLPGEEDRTRLGFQGGLSLLVPLGGRFAGTLLAGGAVIPSPFQDGELPANYELRTLWRRSVAGRLEYRL
jgi:hypothetical protein